MPISQTRVTTAFSAQPGNSTPDHLSGFHGELVTADFAGKYYEQTARGNSFYVSTVVAGLAVPISTTTAPTVVLWNPSDSGYNAVLGRYTASYVSGTSVATSIGLNFKSRVGSVVDPVAGSSVEVFTQAALGTNLFNGILGGGNASRMRSAATATNTVTAGAWLRTLLGESALIATTAMNPYGATYDFDGELILPPGVMIFATGAAASGALLAQTLSWVEVPV